MSSNKLVSFSSKKAPVKDKDSSKDVVDEKSTSVNAYSTDDEYKSVILVSPTLRNNLMKSMKGNGKMSTVLVLHATLVTTGSGNLLTTQTLNPSGSSEWSTFATLFDEFRVIGGVMHFEPVYAGSATTGMICASFDNDDATAPSSIDDVLCYQNSSLCSFHKGLRYSFKRPNITPSAYWVDVASPANSVGSVKYVLGYTTASVTIGYYSIRLSVEFRGRR